MPKKCCHHHPIKLNKPKVTLGVAPVAPKKPEVSPTAALVAEAIPKKLEPVEEEAMTGVEPSVSANPPPLLPPFPSLSTQNPLRVCTRRPLNQNGPSLMSLTA